MTQLRFIPLFLLMLFSGTATAAPTPGYRDQLFELSNLLGKAHSLSILCRGRSDQYWRDFMLNLLDLEAPTDGKYRSQLVDSFNTAYTAEQSRFGQCTPQAATELNNIVQQGHELAESLKSSAINEG